MLCSHLWFPTCWLVRQSTGREGLGFCPSENQVLLCSGLQDRAGSRDSSPETCVHEAVERVSWPLKVPFTSTPEVVEGIWGYWPPAQALAVALFLLLHILYKTLFCTWRSLFETIHSLLESDCCDTCVYKANIFLSRVKYC